MSRERTSLLLLAGVCAAFVTPIALVLYARVPVGLALLGLLGVVSGGLVFVRHTVTRRT